MAKNTRIPTLQEMEEYIEHFKEDPIHNSISDLDHVAIHHEMTRRIFTVDMTDDTKVTAWKFCKALANYAHAPVTASDYKRMEKWVEETALIDVLLEACDNYFPNPEFRYSFDIIGFFYSVALISQSQYRRQDCLNLLNKITQYYVDTKDELHTVLLRNMKILPKNHSDLVQFKTALESIC